MKFQRNTNFQRWNISSQDGKCFWLSVLCVFVCVCVYKLTPIFTIAILLSIVWHSVQIKNQYLFVWQCLSAGAHPSSQFDVCTHVTNINISIFFVFSLLNSWKHLKPSVEFSHSSTMHFFSQLIEIYTTTTRSCTRWKCVCVCDFD